MRNGLDLSNLISELEYRHENRRDFLVNTKAITIIPPSDDDPVHIRFKRPDGKRWQFPMTHHMLTQLCGFLHVSMLLVDSLLTKGTQREREALCHLLTVRLQDNEAIRMVRTQHEFFAEPIARAFLSDRYRQIDNWPLTEAIVPIIQSNPKLKLMSSYISDTNLYLKIVNTAITGEVGRVTSKGHEVGDVVQLGVIISNSEVGVGRVQVRTFLFRSICTNGMVAMEVTNKIGKTHVGRIQQADSETLIMSEDVNDNDDFIVSVKETIIKALNDETLLKTIAKKFEATRKDEVIGDEEAVWAYLGKMYNFGVEELKSITRYYRENSDKNRFGVINAVTQFAARNKTASYDRVTELEVIGGQILDMDKATWKRVSTQMLPADPTTAVETKNETTT